MFKPEKLLTKKQQEGLAEELGRIQAIPAINRNSDLGPTGSFIDIKKCNKCPTARKTACHNGEPVPC